MVTDRVAKELRAALDTMRGERDQLSKQISAMEALLSQMGAPTKRGPGRPKGTGVKRGPGRPRKAESAAPAAGEAPARRGPGRPKGSKNKGAKRGPGRPKGSKAAGRRAPKWSPQAREAARARMKAYWAARKKSG